VFQDEVREAFDLFDSNKNGAIDASELKDVFAMLALEPSHAELEEYIAKYDKDNNGEIEFSEFLSLFEEFRSKRDDAALREAFDFLDMTKEGFITPAELARGMEQLGAKCTLAEAQLMVKHADTRGDNDGQVSWEDFKSYLS
jgi:Ca2+-binding EF-hand superfamily protein